MNVTNKFEALFKRIGGVVEESNKINPDHYSWIRLRSGEKKDLVIPIVSIKNSELIVDMWRFPKSYDNIYPLVPFKQECNRIWSLLLREEKLYTVYNSTYIDKNPKNVDYEKYNCFHGYKSEVVKVPHIKLSMIDNENKAVWNSDKIDSGVKYDQMFQSWDQEHGTASRFEIAGRENERMLNALKIYELDIKKHGKYTVEDYLVLVEKKVNFMMPIDKIKNLKQVKIEWIQK